MEQGQGKEPQQLRGLQGLLFALSQQTSQVLGKPMPSTENLDNNSHAIELLHDSLAAIQHLKRALWANHQAQLNGSVRDEQSRATSPTPLQDDSFSKYFYQQKVQLLEQQLHLTRCKLENVERQLQQTRQNADAYNAANTLLCQQLCAAQQHNPSSQPVDGIPPSPCPALAACQADSKVRIEQLQELEKQNAQLYEQNHQLATHIYEQRCASWTHALDLLRVGARISVVPLLELINSRQAICDELGRLAARSLHKLLRSDGGDDGGDDDDDAQSSSSAQAQRQGEGRASSASSSSSSPRSASLLQGLRPSLAAANEERRLLQQRVQQLEARLQGRLQQQAASSGAAISQARALLCDWSGSPAQVAALRAAASELAAQLHCLQQYGWPPPEALPQQELQQQLEEQRQELARLQQLLAGLKRRFEGIMTDFDSDDALRALVANTVERRGLQAQLETAQQQLEELQKNVTQLRKQRQAAQVLASSAYKALAAANVGAFLGSGKSALGQGSGQLGKGDPLEQQLQRCCCFAAAAADRIQWLEGRVEELRRGPPPAAAAAAAAAASEGAEAAGVVETLAARLRGCQASARTAHAARAAAERERDDALALLGELRQQQREQQQQQQQQQREEVEQRGAQRQLGAKVSRAKPVPAGVHGKVKGSKAVW